jgi:hypothetical protein
MRAAFVIAALIVPVIALALPDDATLSLLLVGTWHGHRHDTQYRADGMWVMDPPDEGDNSRGKWRIEHGRLITTWRFGGGSSDSTAVEEIIELTEKTFSPASFHRRDQVDLKARFCRARFSLSLAKRQRNSPRLAGMKGFRVAH